MMNRIKLSAWFASIRMLDSLLIYCKWTFYIFVGSIVLYWMLPTRLWFSVYSLKVEDTYLGDEIKLKLDRSIRGNFSAQWVVTIRRKDGPTYDVVCDLVGTSNYSRSATQGTIERSFTWLVQGQRCYTPLTVGTHQIQIAWIFTPPGTFERREEVISNDFEIRARP